METLLVLFLATLPITVPIAVYWISKKAANKWKPQNLSMLALTSILLFGLLSPYIMICSAKNPATSSSFIRIVGMLGIALLAFTAFSIWGNWFVSWMG